MRIFAEFKRRETLLTLVAAVVAVFVTPLLTPDGVSWWAETLVWLGVLFAGVILLALGTAAWDLSREKPAPPEDRDDRQGM